MSPNSSTLGSSSPDALDGFSPLPRSSAPSLPAADDGEEDEGEEGAQLPRELGEGPSGHASRWAVEDDEGEDELDDRAGGGGDQGEEENDRVGREGEEDEVEAAVRHDAADDVKREQGADAHPSPAAPDNEAAREVRVDWGKETLDDEIRPLDFDAAFGQQLGVHQSKQEEMLTEYTHEMVTTLIEAEVWATTYLRNLAASHNAALAEAKERIAEEEVYQEETRRNLLLVKDQVKEAMDRLKSMQSLALVRVRRSESVEPSAKRARLA